MSRASELREIAERLLVLTREADQQDPISRAVDSSPAESALIKGGGSQHFRPEFADPTVLRRLAESVLSARRSRESDFPVDLFADPAWDMLLDLYIQRSVGRRIAVSSLCIASQAPQATALRWIKMLEQHSLIVREIDRTDARRSLISLSRTGEIAMTRVLIAMSRHLRPTLVTPLTRLESQTG